MKIRRLTLKVKLETQGQISHWFEFDLEGQPTPFQEIYGARVLYYLRVEIRTVSEVNFPNLTFVVQIQSDSHRVPVVQMGSDWSKFQVEMAFSNWLRRLLPTPKLGPLPKPEIEPVCPPLFEE